MATKHTRLPVAPSAAAELPGSCPAPASSSSDQASTSSAGGGAGSLSLQCHAELRAVRKLIRKTLQCIGADDQTG